MLVRIFTIKCFVADWSIRVKLNMIHLYLLFLMLVSVCLCVVLLSTVVEGRALLEVTWLIAWHEPDTLSLPCNLYKEFLVAYWKPMGAFDWIICHLSVLITVLQMKVFGFWLLPGHRRASVGFIWAWNAQLAGSSGPDM